VTDISLTWSLPLARADWSVVNGQLLAGNDLQSAVLVSLFTDRRAAPDFVPPDRSNDRRGVWFDTYETSLIGSRLWQLQRAKISNRAVLLQQAQDYCVEALQWLLDDGVAAQVDVQTYFITPTTLGITVQLIKPDSTALRFQYSWAWNFSPVVPPPSLLPTSRPVLASSIASASSTAPASGAP
jgi:phage gp46-like protein